MAIKGYSVFPKALLEPHYYDVKRNILDTRWRGASHPSAEKQSVYSNSAAPADWAKDN